MQAILKAYKTNEVSRAAKCDVGAPLPRTTHKSLTLPTHTPTAFRSDPHPRLGPRGHVQHGCRPWLVMLAALMRTAESVLCRLTHALLSQTTTSAHTTRR